MSQPTTPKQRIKREAVVVENILPEGAKRQRKRKLLPMEDQFVEMIEAPTSYVETNDVENATTADAEVQGLKWKQTIKSLVCTGDECKLSEETEDDSNKVLQHRLGLHILKILQNEIGVPIILNADQGGFNALLRFAIGDLKALTETPKLCRSEARI